MLFVENCAMMPKIKIGLEYVYIHILVASRVSIQLFVISVGLGLCENLSKLWEKSDNVFCYECMDPIKKLVEGR